MSKYLPDAQSVKAAAKTYVKDQNLAVVPVNGKIPDGVKGWQTGKINNELDVDRFFKAKHNVGIVTGRYAHDDHPQDVRYWVLDVDWKEEYILPEDAPADAKAARVPPTWGEDGRPVRTPDTNLTKNGYEALDALIAQHGPLPETWVVRTGGGGTHYYWRLPENVDVPGTTDVRPFIDIRGTGGQVVAPPSMHPETGVEYTWHSTAQAAAYAPQWLLDLAFERERLRQEKATAARAAAEQRRKSTPQPQAEEPNEAQQMSREYAVRSLEGACNDVRTAEQGSRHNTLLSKTLRISKLFGGRGILTDEEIITAFTAAGLDSGMPEGDVERTVTYGMTKGEEGRSDAYPITPVNNLAAGQAFMSAVISSISGQQGGSPPPPPSSPPPGGGGNGGGATPPPQPQARAPRPPRPALRPNQINVEDRQASAIVADAWVRLAPSPTLFLDEERRLIEYEARDVRDEPKLMTPGRFSLHLMNCAEWVEARFNTRSNMWMIRNVNPPSILGPAMMSDTNAPLRVLRHIGRTPILVDLGTMPDGSRNLKLLWDGGYDTESQTYMLDHGIVREPLDIAQAKELLDFWTADWGFATESDRTNALALYLLPFVRPAVRGPTPLHLAEASEVDFGKSRVIRTMLTPAMGTPPGPSKIDMTDETEFDKKIVSYLRAKSQALFFDNVKADKGPLENSVLEMLLTDERYSGRILGKSEMATFTNTAAWAMTMNSGSLGPDLMRRTVSIRLATRPPDEANRKIANVFDWTMKYRHLLVSAAVTLIEHWAAQGRPRATKALNSFEAWSDMVGGILECAGYAPLDGNRSEAQERLSGIEMDFVQFVNVWANRHKEQRVAVSVLRQLADDNDLLQSKIRGPGEANGKAMERDRSMGVFLASRNEVVRDGYRLRSGYTNGARRYWLEKTPERRAQEERDAKLMAALTNPTNFKP